MRRRILKGLDEEEVDMLFLIEHELSSLFSRRSRAQAKLPDCIHLQLHMIIILKYCHDR